MITQYRIIAGTFEGENFHGMLNHVQVGVDMPKFHEEHFRRWLSNHEKICENFLPRKFPRYTVSLW
jgi:hypothetical protein